MLPVILRLGKYLGIAALVLFLVVFTWANWRPLSPGEKANPVLFVQLDSNPISDSLKKVIITNDIGKIDGVNTSVINFESQIISAGFNIYETDFEEIKSIIQEKHNYTLTPKILKSTGRVCPMGTSLTLSKRVRRLLCIRS